MQHIYFISYWQVTGPGNIDVEIDREIKNIKDIQFLQKMLADKIGGGEAVITNYILMRTE